MQYCQYQITYIKCYEVIHLLSYKCTHINGYTSTSKYLLYFTISPSLITLLVSASLLLFMLKVTRSFYEIDNRTPGTGGLAMDLWCPSSGPTAQVILKPPPDACMQMSHDGGHLQTRKKKRFVCCLCKLSAYDTQLLLPPTLGLLPVSRRSALR